MLQMIEEPTRGENILDLISIVEVINSGYLDHDMIEVNTNYSITEKEKIMNLDQ